MTKTKVPDNPLDKTQKDDAGYTLVETLVSLAILISVLLPSLLFLGYVAQHPLNRQRILAQGIAQVEMEQVLFREEYLTLEKTVDQRWRVVRTIVKGAAPLVGIRVEVYRSASAPKPLAVLYTERMCMECYLSDSYGE